MTGWSVAFVLYLIPVLVGLVSNRSNTTRDPHLWENLLWPPLMFVGAIMLYRENKKKP